MDAVAKQKRILQVLEEAYRARAGDEGLEELVDRFLPFEATEWIFRALEAGGVKRGKKKDQREVSPATVAEEIAERAVGLAKKPAVVLGSRFGLLAGMLGAELGVDPNGARVALARKAWPDTRFSEQDPFDWVPEKKYQFFLLHRLCAELPRQKGFVAYRELLDRVIAGGTSSAHALIVDELRFQDDLVEILARSNCEILDLATLVDRKSVVIVAGLGEV